MNKCVVYLRWLMLVAVACFVFSTFLHYGSSVQSTVFIATSAIPSVSREISIFTPIYAGKHAQYSSGFTYCIVGKPFQTRGLSTVVKKERVTANTTGEDCRKICLEKETIFAVLWRGDCWCANHPLNSRIARPLAVCDAQCNHTIAEDCEDKVDAVYMKTRSTNGHTEWSIWMPMGKTGLRSRFKDCDRSNGPCKPTMEYKSSDRSFNSTDVPPFVGCFTGASLLEHTTLNVSYTSLISNSAETTIYQRCIKLCSVAGSGYAAVHRNSDQVYSCACSDTLAQSQPFDGCDIGKGLTVFSIRDRDTLQFLPPVGNKRRVLVIGRYRSGSSMTQSFFVRNPGAFSFFEPAHVIDDAGDQVYYPEPGFKMVSAMMQCDADAVPTMVNAAMSVWSQTMLKTRGQLSDNLAEPIAECARGNTGRDCTPYMKEACDRAEFIDIKTIRLLDAAYIEEFAIQNPDVHVIHLVRDPRGLVAAEAKYSAHPEYSKLCDNLLEISVIVKKLKDKGLSNIHEVYYDELAVEPVDAGERIYREMGMEMPAAVRHFLSHDGYNTSDIPRGDQEVIKDDPIKHVYGFLSEYTLANILNIDKDCTAFYDFHSPRYLPFRTLYNERPEQISQFLSLKNKKWILQNSEQLTAT